MNSVSYYNLEAVFSRDAILIYQSEIKYYNLKFFGEDVIDKEGYESHSDGKFLTLTSPTKINTFFFN